MKKSEAILREIKKAKESASNSAIAETIKTIDEKGKIDKKRIREIAETEAYKFIEMMQSEKEEIANAAYIATVDYLHGRDYDYINMDIINNDYSAFYSKLPAEITYPVIIPLSQTLKLFYQFAADAKDRNDYKQHLDHVKTISMLTNMLRRFAADEDNVSTWLSIVLPCCNQWAKINEEITFDEIYHKLMNNRSIYRYIRDLNPHVTSLIITELGLRYNDKVKEKYDKQNELRILKQHKRLQSKQL